MRKKQYEIRKVVQKIPIFKGFEHNEIRAILRICTSVPIAAGETIYAKGEPSHDMLILLKGELIVAGESGETLALIHAGGSVGEMGLFTGLPRSARITSYEPSVGIVIKKRDLIEVLKRNDEMHVKLLYNLVSLLSNRLVDTGSLVESLQSTDGDEDGDEVEYDEDMDDEEWDDEDDANDEDITQDNQTGDDG